MFLKSQHNHPADHNNSPKNPNHPPFPEHHIRPSIHRLHIAHKTHVIFHPFVNHLFETRSVDMSPLYVRESPEHRYSYHWLPLLKLTFEMNPYLSL